MEGQNIDIKDTYAEVGNDARVFILNALPSPHLNNLNYWQV
jgi:hypothetical protein